MKRANILIIVFMGVLLTTAGLQAQQANTRLIGRELTANRLITFDGTLKDADGQPRQETVGITFTIYGSQEGGDALWRESQTVQTDEQGRYSALLGITEQEGLPLEVFSSGKAQWLGVQIQGEDEQPRVLLVAVPYALKAADADTVGGKSLSSFMLYEDLAKPGFAGIIRDQGIMFPDGTIQRTAAGGVVMSSAGVARGGTVQGSGEGAGADLGADVTGYFSRVPTEQLANKSISGVKAGTGPSGGAGSGTLTLSGANITSDMILSVSGSVSQAGVISGNNTATDGKGVVGFATAIGDVTNYGGWFQAEGNSGRAVYGVAPAVGSITNYGGYFEAEGNSGRAVYGVAPAVGSITNYGGYFEAEGNSGRAVYGVAPAVGSITNYGGYFEADGAYGYGVYGYAPGTGGYGVYGYAPGTYGWGVWGNAPSTNGYAGYFTGNVYVTGTLYKAGGAFKIDHPLDPENKYLYHSFVESPDMMNIYNGNVVLDSGGEAWVELPEWFEALNKDFRYQLTCIGGFAQVYIAEKVSGNRFKIAGGISGLEVSWQVTGVRKDSYAEAHRIPVEELKKPGEQGYYIHPDLYGQPEEKSLDWARNPEMMKKMKEEREKVEKSKGE